MTALAEALERLGAPAGKVELLARFGELLREANRRTNLTAARSDEALAEQIADAFSLVPHVHGPLADVGSGGGLPGIPIAILCEVPVTLIEATAKKAVFLKEFLLELELDGSVLAQRAEIVGQDPAHRERYRHATARAVASAPAVAELTLPLVEVGGTALLQRGTIDEAERRALTDCAPMLGAAVVEEVRLQGALRVFVLAKKSPAPRRFPRRNGIPEKRPLCL